LAPGVALDYVQKSIQEEIDRGDESEFLADMMQGSSTLFADDDQYADLLINLLRGMNE